MNMLFSVRPTLSTIVPAKDVVKLPNEEDLVAPHRRLNHAHSQGRVRHTLKPVPHLLTVCLAVSPSV